MTTINKELLVPYSAEQMYGLVNDIESYPEFLKWCSKAAIQEKSADGKCITAQIGLMYSGFAQQFTTKNTTGFIKENNQDNIIITMKLVDGPFKYLNGTWVFTNLGATGSKVKLELEFEFNNFLLGMTFSKIFQQIIEEFVDSFYKRAQVVYGK